MTTKEWAALLSGREYGKEITWQEQEQAKLDGIVIAFGQSDDLMEFRGAIHDEIDCYDGGTAYIDPKTKELFIHECAEVDCPYEKREKERCIEIDAIWCAPDSPDWTYQTEIPHETFKIMEDGEVYCQGIVFSVDELGCVRRKGI